MDLRRPVTSPNVRVGPKLDQQSSSIEDLCFSVCPLGEYRGSNRLAALVDLRRSVEALGAMEYAHRKVKRLAALVDLCCSLDPLNVMDRRRIDGIEDLCCTVRFLSVAHQITKRLAALVDLRCSLGPLDVMEGRRIGGVKGLRCTVCFLSVPDEIRDIPGPREKRDSRGEICRQ